MSQTESLSERVEEVQEKVQLQTRSVTVESRLSEIENKLDNLNTDLKSLQESVTTLHHYSGIIKSIVDDQIPDSVPEAKDAVRELSKFEDSDIIDELMETQSGSYTEQIEEIQDSVEQANSDLENQLDGFRDKWRSRLSSAKHVQRILGEADSIQELSSRILEFIENDVEDESHEINRLASKWESLKNEWESYQTARSFDELSEEYGLSKNTIEVLESLSFDENVSISDIDSQTIDEIKQIDSLQSNLYIFLKTN